VSEKEQKSTNRTSSPYLIPLAIVVAGALVGAGLYFGGQRGASPTTPVVGQRQPAETGEQGSEGQVAGEEVPQYETTTGNFVVLNDEPCNENGKPIVYYFGSSGCPHCIWEHPIIKEVMANFADQISFHDLMDKQEEFEVFQKYSQINGGGIPFIVLGCQYARVGSGEQAGEEAEKQALTELICKLTNNQPPQVCP